MDLPQVIVELDGKTLFQEETPSQEASGIDVTDTDSAPSDAGDHERIAVRTPLLVPLFLGRLIEVPGMTGRSSGRQ